MPLPVSRSTRATLRRAAMLLCAVSLAPAASARAQVGASIVEVVVEQEGQIVVDPVVRGLIETSVGEPLSMREVRETITHLMSLNRFEDVRPAAEPADGGVRLRYVLVPLHPVDRVEFRGSLGLSPGALEAVLQSRYGGPPSAARAEEAADALRAEYRRRGFPDARVATRLEETHNPDRATLAFEIAAGTRAIIEDVRFTQIDADERSTIVSVPDIRRGEPYDEPAIDRRLSEWEDGLHARGYYEARASHGVSYPGGGAFVQVNLVRGPLVVVAFTGDALPASERERLVPVRAERSADEDLLEDAGRAIERYLHARGYRDASAPHTREERGEELVITFNVSRGPRYTVETVTIAGNAAIPDAELRTLLGLEAGAPFVRTTLDAGAAAIRDLYRSRGFTRAEVKRDERVLPAGASDGTRRLEVVVQIAEGPRALVGTVTFEGNESIASAELGALTSLREGQPYSERQLVLDRDRVDLEYRNRGYESVVVDPNPTPSEDETRTDIRFAISEGPQSIVDHIIIVGNQRISTDTIERELLLRPGEPLGYSALIESRARLVALGAFRRIQIEPLAHGGEARRDVLVQVEESPPRVLGLGGGVEGTFLLRPTGEGGQAEERFEVAPRASFEIGRRNLWGKNRSVNLFTRVSLRSRDALVQDELVPGEITTESGRGFNEYRVIGSFREPKPFQLPADVLVTSIFEQAIRSSFNFRRRELRAQAGWRPSSLYTLDGIYSIQRTELFDVDITAEDQPLIDRLFPQVRLSKMTGSIIRNTRDDDLDPSRGTLVIVTGDLAARAIGSEVGFLKTYVQGFSYHRLPTARRAVVALGARLGVAHGFPRDVPSVDESGAPVLGPGGEQLVEVVEDLPASERFFAGGDTTVRGFSLDRLGTERTITPTGFPTGGNGVVVLNSELRVNVLNAIQAIGFVDAGNVFPKADDLDLTDLRPTAGFGVMYRSSVTGLGVRVDLGFNLDRRELVPGRFERGNVLHILLGQAF